jgi:hypothetical protein
MNCPDCRADVPAGVFCGNCGGYLNPQPGDGPKWLRPRAFCAAPEEHVLRPSIASSLFPHLSALSRTPFNLGLLVIALVMAVCVETKLPGALIVVSSLGLPVLFLIYRQQSGAYQDIPRSTLLLTAGLGIAIGVGWVLLTGDLVVRETGAPFDAGIAGSRVLRNGLGVTEGGVALMMVPAIAVRLLRPGCREALHGFVIGVLSALSFTAAATFTRLAPQFAAGPIAQDKPVQWLLVEAGIRGATVPVTAACAGGLIGAALWFSRPAGLTRLPRPAVLLGVGACGGAVLAIYAIVGIIDIAGMPQTTMLAWHVVMAAVALIVLRIGLQLTLLHEAQKPSTGEPQLCLCCRTVVPDMAFCPSCGAAGHASPRSSQVERRDVHPAPDPATGPVWPGYGVPARAYTSAPLARISSLRVLTVWAGTILAVAVPVIGLTALTVKPAPSYNCPPDCGHPPSGTPVATNPRFTAAGGEFEVSYPAPGTAYEISTEANGVTARYTAGGGGVLRLWSKPAAGRSAKEVLTDIMRKSYPNSRTAYSIPNAMVGYQHGYGEVADVWPQDDDASYRHLRIVMLVAVKNGLALIAGAVGPYREFGPDFGPGRPSGANLELAADMGKYVNSFTWRGDPPR